MRTQFSTSRGLKWGQKRGQNWLLAIKWQLQAKHLQISFQKFHCGIYFCQITFSEPFWRFWHFCPKHLKGQWGSKRSNMTHSSKNDPPKTTNLRRDIIIHHKFDTFKSLGQITSFGEPGRSNGSQKGSKNAHFSKTDPRKPQTYTEE